MEEPGCVPLFTNGYSQAQSRMLNCIYTLSLDLSLETRGLKMDRPTKPRCGTLADRRYKATTRKTVPGYTLKGEHRDS